MTFQTMGDPHLGRQFIHGVPLHRRGEREGMVWEQFRKELSNCNAPFHINMGDLFHGAQVSFDTIMGAAWTYRSAARAFPLTDFVILQGNHDVSRDMEKASAFDVFAELVSPIGNIHVIREVNQIDNMLFVPYHPVMSAAELLDEFMYTDADVAFGHWDVDSFGNNHNLIPTRILAELGIMRAYTGHVHKPSRFVRDGVDVTVVGSLQPFAHGEEVNEDLYLTRNLDQVRQCLAMEDAGYGCNYHNKCLRVILQPGEFIDFNIDCLQLTVVRPDQVDEQAVVNLGDFNMESLFTQALEQADVVPALRAEVMQRYAQSG